MPRRRRFPEAADAAQYEVLYNGVGDEPERGAVAVTALARPEGTRLAQRVLDVEGELMLRDRAEIVIHAMIVA